jgi:integrase
MRSPLPSQVAVSDIQAQRRRGAYEAPDPRPEQTRLRDATLVGLLGYSGLRPSEALALCWKDIQPNTILVQRALDIDGSNKTTKGGRARTVRLLTPLSEDLEIWRRSQSALPHPETLLFPRSDGKAWTVTDLGNWRGRTWRRACQYADINPAPRIYDLRHSFASLLLAEGRSVHYVARQLGHGAGLTLRTYGHVIEEFDETPRIDAEDQIRRARQIHSAHQLHKNQNVP